MLRKAKKAEFKGDNMKKILSFMMVAVLLLAGCGGTTDTESTDTGGDSKGKIYFIPIVDTGSYWGGIIEGAQEKADELGYELVIRTSPSNDPDKNNKHIGFLDEAMNDPETVAVAFSANDAEAFDRKIGEVHDAGIPVVLFDADTTTPANRDAYVGTDNYKAGVTLGEAGANYLKDQGVTEGSIATVAVNMTQSTMIDRKDGVQEGFKNVYGEDAANFTFLEPITDDDQSAKSKEKLEAQMISNEDMVAVFSLGSEGPDNGVMEALRASGKEEDIAHFGFDYTPSWANGVNDGLIEGIVDQDSHEIGAKTVEVAASLAEGNEADEMYPIDVVWYDSEGLKTLLDEKEATETE